MLIKVKIKQRCTLQPCDGLCSYILQCLFMKFDIAYEELYPGYTSILNSLHTRWKLFVHSLCLFGNDASRGVSLLHLMALCVKRIQENLLFTDCLCSPMNSGSLHQIYFWIHIEWCYTRSTDNYKLFLGKQAHVIPPPAFCLAIQGQ